ncbi:MAG: methyltransferase domain-containing protein [Polyangiaceae bacterium]
MKDERDPAPPGHRSPSIPPAGLAAPSTVPRPSRPPPGRAESAPPPSNRKGTLDGLQPNIPAAAPTVPNAVAGSGFQEEDFDAERTLVVDPDDAPTADYDPRQMSYNPRARGVYAQSQPAPAMPPPAASPDSEAAARTSRRTSRRTVKLVDDQAQAVATPDETATPVEGIPTLDRSVAIESAPSDDLASADEEITIVKALRIINIGSEPPPPIRSAFATWPPPALTSAPLDAPVGADISVSPGFSPPAPAGAIDAPIIPPPPIAPAVAQAQQAAPAVEVDAVEIHDEREDLLDDDLEIESAPPVPEATTPPAPAAAAASPKRPPPPPKKTESAKADSTAPRVKPWWEDLFSEEYIRTHDRPPESVVRREVDFIEESLGMEKHAVVLDLACGRGDHTIALASRGYSVVGLDYSTGMLDLAARQVQERQKADPNFTAPSFVQGDMRDLPYEEAFDGVYCWATSFGFFEDDKNLAVLANIHRALRQGGMFLLDIVNRDYVAPRSPSLVWFEGSQCVCMDDMYVDFFTSRMKVKRTAMFEGGKSRELDYTIRLYSLHELGKMLHEVGFKVLEVTGHPVHPGVFFGTESPRLIVLSERS